MSTETMIKTETGEFIDGKLIVAIVRETKDEKPNVWLLQIADRPNPMRFEYKEIHRFLKARRIRHDQYFVDFT